MARLSHDLAVLSVKAGMRRDAVRWYGQSIDAYLYAGFTEAATAMCHKLIQFEPRVIRTRATLAMLYLAAGRDLEAEAEIVDYVDATRRHGERLELTHQRLRLLAALADGHRVRTLIGESLLELGAEEAGREVLQRVKREQRGEPPRPPTEQERWRFLLEGALLAAENNLPGSGAERVQATGNAIRG
jgi:hypothetical protein